MGNSTQGIRASSALICAVFAIGFGWGCASSLGGGPAYEFFAAPDPDDAWSRKIRLWQRRELGDSGSAAPAAVAEAGGVGAVGDPDSGNLRAKFDAFRAERKRALAREVADWIQRQAREHYVADGPIDRWATLEETFRSNGDDCDGLELLTYHFLRDLGFGDDEVYRAIIYRRSDGQHHMVTLWFEDRDDPWVIDPTGAMTSGMPRMSSVPDWIPLKVFSEDREFSVRQQAAVRPASTR
jgi:hypothetical protein